MAEAIPSNSNIQTVPSAKWNLHYFAGVFWLVYFLTNSYVWINDLIPFPSYYPLIGTYLLYLALTSPLQVAEFISKPITWLWAFTALVPLSLFLLSSSGNPYGWLSVITRVVFFSVLAGSGVLLLHKDSRRILRTAARISLVFAVIINFGDLVFYNPYNSAEVTGRSAGFYGDANISAAAIGSLLLMSVDLNKQTVRSFFFVGISVLAIIATQSRSGMTFGVLLLAAYLFLPSGRGTFSIGARLGIGAAGLLMMVIVILGVGQLLGIDSEQAWRIKSLVTLDVGDTSSQGRIASAQEAFRTFSDSFWTGMGLGSTRIYGYFSHNAYLQIGLEYGIFGVLTYVAVIGYGFVKVFRFGFRRSLGHLLLTFQIAYYSLFSHTVQNNSLVAVVFAAMIVNATIAEDEDQGEETP